MRRDICFDSSAAPAQIWGKNATPQVAAHRELFAGGEGNSHRLCWAVKCFLLWEICSNNTNTNLRHILLKDRHAQTHMHTGGRGGGTKDKQKVTQKVTGLTQAVRCSYLWCQVCQIVDKVGVNCLTRDLFFLFSCVREKKRKRCLINVYNEQNFNHLRGNTHKP